jgi:hypothetical protein
MRRWVCLLWTCLAFRQMDVPHVTETTSFCTIYKSSVSSGFAKQIMPTLPILRYNSNLFTWTIISLTAAKFKPHIFSDSRQSQSQSHIATDGQSICNSWCRAPSGAHDQIFITFRQLRSCFCGALSLTRERVCLLYMLLVIASRVSDLRLPFSSPPTTRRVTVEVFEPASTRVGEHLILSARSLITVSLTI